MAAARALTYCEATTLTREALDECSVADVLEGFRAKDPLFRSLSFDTIAGAGPNGAIIHYRAEPSSCRGLRAGELFLLDSGAQYEPAMADLGNGKFIVTWRDDHGSYHDTNDNDSTTGSSYDVRGQIFTTVDDNGDALTTPEALGGDFRINTWTSSSQYLPSVTALEGTNAGFVVTWQDDSGQNGGSSSDIRGQLFDITGTPVGDEFMANTYISSQQVDPSVASLADGGFMVTWESSGQDGSGYGIYGQRFDVSMTGDTPGATPAEMMLVAMVTGLVFN